MCSVDDEAFKADGRWLANHYVCPCGCTWRDHWSCACDDDCPDCGTTCSPDDSDDLTSEAVESCPYLAPFALPPEGQSAP